MRYVHLRSFPLTYEINKDGDIRKRTNHGFIKYERYHEDVGTYVDIKVNDKIQKCLLAELILHSFTGYKVGEYRIRYKDGNINHVTLDNLNLKPIPNDLKTKYLITDSELIGRWRCDSRASAANRRYGHLNQLITPNEVLRCLIVCEYKCFYCTKSLMPHKWHLDHYVPVGKDGANEFLNLRASCILCNMMKTDMTYEQFAKRAYIVYTVFMEHNPGFYFNIGSIGEIKKEATNG